MRTILNSLRIILSIRNTININSILNGIRHIPFIGKHISERIYGVRAIKIITLIVSLHIEIIKAFFGKFAIFALLSFVAFPIGDYYDGVSSTAYLYGFAVLSLFIMSFNNVFAITAEAKYAVFHLGMDAKKYILAILTYQSFNTFAGYVFFGIPSALILKVPWFLALLIPVAGVGLHFARCGFMMLSYSLKQKAGRIASKKGVPASIGGNTWLTALFDFALFFGSIAGAFWVIGLNLHLIGEIAVIVYALLLIPGFFLIRKFPYGLYRTALFAEDERRKITEVKQKNEIIKTKELRFENVQASSSRKGFEYLNDLFIKRHAKVLLGRLIGAGVGTAVTITLLCIYLYYELSRFDSPTESTLRYIFTWHPGLFVFLLFILNSTESFAHALFANCDSALLNFGFYKTPEALLRMFTIRCKSAVKLNCIPAVLMTVFATVTILITGGEDFFLQCLFTALVILLSVILFSVRHMTLYYLMQPYNGDFMVKNHVYTFFNVFAGLFYTVLIIIPMDSLILTGILTVLTVPYIPVSRMLVRKFAPRTFRVK